MNVVVTLLNAAMSRKDSIIVTTASKLSVSILETLSESSSERGTGGAGILSSELGSDGARIPRLNIVVAFLVILNALS